MLRNQTRILMAEVGQGGTSIIAPPNPEPATTTPVEPVAQPVAPLTKDDLKSFAIEMRNGIFADFRKAGVFEKDAKGKEPTVDPKSPTTQTQPAAAPDTLKFRSLERNLGKLGLSSRLNESQMQRLDRAFVEENPADVESWLKDYFGDLGVAQTPQPAATAVPAAQVQPARVQSATPVSDRGAPPPVNTSLEDMKLTTMAESDRAALIRQKGLPWFRDKLMAEMKGVKLDIRSLG